MQQPAQQKQPPLLPHQEALVLRPLCWAQHLPARAPQQQATLVPVQSPVDLTPLRPAQTTDKVSDHIG